MLRSLVTVIVLAGCVVLCLLVGALLPTEDPARELIKVLAGIFTFLAVGLGGWLTLREPPSK